MTFFLKEGIDDELRRALLLSLEDFYQPPETVTASVEKYVFLFVPFKKNTIF
jgi:hypothetical protein